jgi:hypothetical protein
MLSDRVLLLLEARGIELHARGLLDELDHRLAAVADDVAVLVEPLVEPPEPS